MRANVEGRQLSTGVTSKLGKRCRRCRDEKLAKVNTLSHDEVAAGFAEHGCRLIDIYRKSSTPMQFVCACGKIGCKSWNSFQSGSPQCRACGHKNTSNKLTGRTKNGIVVTQQYINKLFSDNGCKTVGKYIKSSVPFAYVCSCGAESSIRLFDFIRGQRCRACGYRKVREANARKREATNEHSTRLRIVKKKCYSMLGKCRMKLFLGKTDRSHIVLGYSPADLLRHLMSHEDWKELYTNGNWHIDHIFPIKAFVDYGVSDPRIINCLENLRPLSSKDNIAKGAKYDQREFEAFLCNYGIEL